MTEHDRRSPPSNHFIWQTDRAFTLLHERVFWGGQGVLLWALWQQQWLGVGLGALCMLGGLALALYQRAVRWPHHAGHAPSETCL